MDEEKVIKSLGIILSAAQPLLFPESDSSSLELDTEGSDIEPPSQPRKLPKTRKYFEMVEDMDESEFRSHFRL